jgi:hypothetical protein
MIQVLCRHHVHDNVPKNRRCGDDVMDVIEPPLPRRQPSSHSAVDRDSNFYDLFMIIILFISGG